MPSTSESITRVTLLQRAQAKSDSPAWEEVLRYYEPFIRKTLVHFRVQPSEIDDVCQQVLARLWQELRKFTPDKKRARFRTWLTTLIRNVAINDYRKRKRNSPPSGFATQSISNLADNSSELEKIVEIEWQRHVVALAMERIEQIFTGKAIEVFLRTSEGESFEEVSKSLGISKQSAHVLKYRVKKRLLYEINQIRKSLELPGEQT